MTPSDCGCSFHKGELVLCATHAAINRARNAERPRWWVRLLDWLKRRG